MRRFNLVAMLSLGILAATGCKDQPGKDQSVRDYIKRGFPTNTPPTQSLYAWLQDIHASRVAYCELEQFFYDHIQKDHGGMINGVAITPQNAICWPAGGPGHAPPPEPPGEW